MIDSILYPKHFPTTIDVSNFQYENIIIYGVGASMEGSYHALVSRELYLLEGYLYFHLHVHIFFLGNGSMKKQFLNVGFLVR